jgi:ankyrin repeat protein
MKNLETELAANEGFLNHSWRFALTERFAMLFFALLTAVFSTAWAGTNEDLLVAAQKGNVAGVTAALAAGADINARDSNGWTALQTAAANRDMVEFTKTQDIVKLLIEKGADVNARDKYGGTALIWATSVTHPIEIAKLLIAAGADVNAKGNNGWRPLMSAGFGNFELAELLIAKGADVNAKDDKGSTALAVAAMMGGNVNYVKFLIAKKADVNTKDNNGWTPLRLTTNAQVAEILKAAGAK